MSRQAKVLGVVMLGCFAAGLLQGPAIAGGAPIDFDRRYYLPGETARGSTTFGAGSVGLHMLDRGPFYAYLVRRIGHIDPPRIPANAMPLGPIQMRLVDDSSWVTYRANLSFTVPQVPSGRYVIEYCNMPCSVAGVGELWGGGIRVYQNADEARAQLKVERLKARIQQIRASRGHVLRRITRRSDAQEVELRDLRASNHEKSETIEELTAELVAERVRESETPWWGIAVWVVVAGLLALGGGRTLKRARQSRIRAPSPGVREEAPRQQRDLEPVP